MRLRRAIACFLFTTLCSGSLLSQTQQQPVRRKSKILQNLELSTSLTSSNRKMVSYDEYYTISSYGGYGYSSYYPLPNKSHFNWSSQLGLVYQSKFLWMTVEIGYERIRYEHGFTLEKFWGDPHWMPGSSGGKEIYVDTISGYGNNLLFAIGIGSPLLNKSKKFNIIPRLKVTALYNVNNHLNVNYLNFRWYGISYEHPVYTLNMETTTYPSRFLMNKNSFDITAGIQLKAGPFHHWSFGLDLAYALKSSPILVFEKYRYTEKLYFRNSVTVTYKL